MPPCCTAFPWSLGWLAAVLTWQMLGSLEQLSEQGRLSLQRRGWLKFFFPIVLTLIWSKTSSHTPVTWLLSATVYRVSSWLSSMWEEWRNMTLLSAKALCKHLCERRGTTNHDYTFKNWSVFPSAAPCAPVINPQTPNAATGTSLRVCWGLFSDDTVECYQLCYKPVSNERHSDEQAGEEAWAQGFTPALHWQNQLCQSAPACLVHSVCHQNCHICHHHLLCPSSPVRSAMLPAAAGPITGPKTGHGSSRDSRNGKGTVDEVTRISGGWALH